MCDMNDEVMQEDSVYFMFDIIHLCGKCVFINKSLTVSGW